MPVCYNTKPANKNFSMPKIQTTIRINNDTSNPINVDCVIAGEKYALNMWAWEIEKVIRISLVVGDKEEIDITKTLTPRAIALFTSQAGTEVDQIIDALEGNADENVAVEEKKEDSLFEMAANITRAHVKAVYGIDLNGKGGVK
jgi:hypothetical protein